MTAGSQTPYLLGLLSERDATRYLTTPVLQGVERMPRLALDKACTPLDDESRWEAGPVRELIDEAMERFDGEKTTQADAWLAPRLHAMMRMNRREAADSRRWNFLALRLAPDYVLWRNSPKATKRNPVPQVNRAHFVGPYHKQTFSRLWWAAELFRNGPDYGPVEVACGNQESFNTVLRLEIIYHQATAQTMIKLMQEGAVRKGRPLNGLAKAINSAGSTLLFDVLAPDPPWDGRAHDMWVKDAASAFVQYDALPEGPDDGSVTDRDVDALLPLFRELFATADIRGEKPAESE
ncbi:DUF6339 family protein [Actinomadura macrotermitis]|uniref:Uncharacterized protein n=1 Tax=Actinomadura macrotermitis TaxID=2585200 RepID=A0A7K0BTV4_9ACTN|nr:DUF6339 family protein [Actinomadura macrotermitis]MQY04599.1 hypothetical protein [Actinomadura macrotermitis]